MNLTERVPVVEGHLAANKKNIEHRAETLVRRAQQRHTQLRSGNVSVKDAAEWSRFPDRTAGLLYTGEEQCPSCSEYGIVEGDHVLERDRQYEHIGQNDYSVWDDLTVGAEHFSCPTCQLVLDSAELVAAGGLEETFMAVDNDPDDFWEPEYGND